MKKLLTTAAVILSVSLAPAAQDNAQIMKDYMRQMSSEQISLNIIHLNTKTVPLLFQPPMLYSMRARAQQQTMIYVQTVVEVNGELDTTNFVLDQGGTTTPGNPTNINNFTKGKLRLKLGDKVDGVVTFDTLVDLSKPFSIRHGFDKPAEFRLSEAQVKALAPAAPAAPAAQ